jgi:hypothetical protein
MPGGGGCNALHYKQSDEEREDGFALLIPPEWRKSEPMEDSDDWVACERVCSVIIL